MPICNLKSLFIIYSLNPVLSIIKNASWNMENKQWWIRKGLEEIYQARLKNTKPDPIFEKHNFHDRRQQYINYRNNWINLANKRRAGYWGKLNLETSKGTSAVSACAQQQIFCIAVFSVQPVVVKHTELPCMPIWNTERCKESGKHFFSTDEYS